MLPRTASPPDFEIVDTYIYEPEGPLACPITVYGGLDDEFVSLEDLREWRKQTSAVCREIMLPGDHFFIHDPECEFVNALRTDALATVIANAEDCHNDNERSQIN